VVIEGFYTLEEINAAEDLDTILAQIKQELQEEIEESVGSVMRIDLYADNPRGVCKIKFGQGLHAEKCIELMNERWFDGRMLKCSFWDGKTDYRHSDTN
jgi:HIV Tat-specific factor 1